MSVSIEFDVVVDIVDHKWEHIEEVGLSEGKGNNIVIVKGCGEGKIVGEEKGQISREE